MPTKIGSNLKQKYRKISYFINFELGGKSHHPGGTSLKGVKIVR